MKSILVFSDSHGYAENMLRVLEKTTPDLMIHLGDGERDLDAVSRRYPMLPIGSVRGNCDRFSSAEETMRLTIEGKRIFAVHGHKHGVKLDLELTRLRYAALEDHADIVLYGHTHAARLDEFAGMQIMNPGSCGSVRRPTFGLITIDGDEIRTEIRSITDSQRETQSF